MTLHSPATPAASLLPQFAAIVGDRYTITDPATLAPFVTESHGTFRGHASMMLRPGSTAEVAAIVKLANDNGIAIVPQGGNTGLVGGQLPFNGEIILSLTRLDKIREIDPASNTMTCEAGVVLQKAQEAAAVADRLFPLSLGAEGSCTIGGNLSSNAGGTAALAYGVARELMLGIEVVLANGQTLNLLSKLKKDNTGYDLRHIFIGAEGTLGVITAAVLKLFPRPRLVECAFVGVPTAEAAIALLTLAQGRIGGIITSFELISGTLVEFAIKYGPGVRDPLAGRHPWYVLIEVTSQWEDGLRENLEELLAEGIERDLVTDATIAASLDQAKSFWHLRHIIPEVQAPAGGSIRQDVAVPIAAVPAFLAEASAAVQVLIPGARPIPFGHAGDGNIHFNVARPADGDTAKFFARRDELNALINGIVMKYRGSISAEHGIGMVKRDTLPKVKDPAALELMRGMKALLDPKNILNPGKVL